MMPIQQRIRAALFHPEDITGPEADKSFSSNLLERSPRLLKILQGDVLHTPEDPQIHMSGSAWGEGDSAAAASGVAGTPRSRGFDHWAR